MLNENEWMCKRCECWCWVGEVLGWPRRMDLVGKFCYGHWGKEQSGREWTVHSQFRKEHPQKAKTVLEFFQSSLKITARLKALEGIEFRFSSYSRWWKRRAYHVIQIFPNSDDYHALGLSRRRRETRLLELPLYCCSLIKGWIKGLKHACRLYILRLLLPRFAATSNDKLSDTSRILLAPSSTKRP
jgi:hypothetical protein